MPQSHLYLRTAFFFFALLHHTGDNPLTALAVGRECGIVPQGIPLYVSDVITQHGEKAIVWRNADEVEPVGYSTAELFQPLIQHVCSCSDFCGCSHLLHFSCSPFQPNLFTQYNDVARGLVSEAGGIPSVQRDHHKKQLLENDQLASSPLYVFTSHPPMILAL